ncbi:NAD(P)H-binding protein [Saccharopolyspora halophila]|uniref:NAD(P)H-binding protein n=1 Tax=Saccharopolyspora halophila TaxID=405551 RepID=A0ABN3GWU2_9PSEU
MHRNKILVIGATGNVGRHAVDLLHASGAGVRAMARNPVALPGEVEVVRGDLIDLSSLRAALESVDAVLLIWPFATVPVNAAVITEIEQYASRIVFVSSAAVRDDVLEQNGPIAAFHAAIEHRIQKSALEWTFLRPYGFASNALSWAPEIRTGDAVRGAHGEAPMTLIHERDVAAVAAHVLTSSGHGSTKHTLTGPERLTQAAQVRTIGEVLGRQLRWVEIPEAEAAAKMLPGSPPEIAKAALDGYAQLIKHPGPITSTVADLTGRPARTFRDWVADRAADFE